MTLHNPPCSDVFLRTNDSFQEDYFLLFVVWPKIAWRGRTFVRRAAACSTMRDSRSLSRRLVSWSSRAALWSRDACRAEPAPCSGSFLLFGSGAEPFLPSPPSPSEAPPCPSPTAPSDGGSRPAAPPPSLRSPSSDRRVPRVSAPARPFVGPDGREFASGRHGNAGAPGFKHSEE